MVSVIVQLSSENGYNSVLSEMLNLWYSISDMTVSDIGLRIA